MQNRQVINAAFRREDVQPAVVLETDSLLALYAHVQHAGLFSVFPHSLMGVLPQGRGVRASRLVPELTRRIGLIVRSNNALSPLVAAKSGSPPGTVSTDSAPSASGSTRGAQRAVVPSPTSTPKAVPGNILPNTISAGTP